MSHSLSIVVDGPGTDPNHRCHWAFAIHPPNSLLGNLLQVTVLDLPSLTYGFDKRTGVEILSNVSEGYFAVASLSVEQHRRADEIISREPAPRNGKDRCQDWVLNCVVALEVEEIVSAGTSEWVAQLVGRPAVEVRSLVGSRWVVR